MSALVVVDVQNEFSPEGARAVPGHADALAAIRCWVEHARAARWPIAWIQHHNRPDESRAFVPGSWGAELSPGCGPRGADGRECLFQKDVFGAFTTTDLHWWLAGLGVTEIVIVGFFAHMCVSTSAREALVRGYRVTLDPAATGAHDIACLPFGRQPASDVTRSALLQLVDMGASLTETPAPRTVEVPADPASRPQP